MESSPRFRTTGSQPEDNPTYAYYHTTSPLAPSQLPPKLRLMCSTGGHILPCPHDKSLRYVGGETRMVSVDRHTTLLELTQRISKTLFKSSYNCSIATSFTVKYQLPSEDLDSLISVTTDEDLENMIDEYERLNSPSRIRLFVFPTNPEPVSSIGSFLDNPSKSEDWFLNALNVTVSGLSDTSSVNCLVDLDDNDGSYEGKTGTNVGGNKSGQDVHSVPDSGLETTSSFGSGSSTPSHANLPPIRVNTAPVVVSGSPVSSAKAIRERSDPFLCYNEKPEQGYVKRHQQQSTGFDLASMDSILSDLTISDQSSTMSQIQSSSSNKPNNTHDQTTRIPIPQHQNIHNFSYSSTMPTTQVDSPRHQSHHQQPQFIQPLQYTHHQNHRPVAVPVTSYYQHYPHHPPMDQESFMYYIPTMQAPQGYNFPLQQPQPSHVETPHAAATKTELHVGVYRATDAGAPHLVRVPSGHQNQYYAAALSTAQYQKMPSGSPLQP